MANSDLENSDFRRWKRANALAEFNNSQDKLVRLFCRIYFWNSNCWEWCQYLSWYLKDTIYVKDKYYFHMRDIRFALSYDVPKEELMKWYKICEDLMDNWHERTPSLRDFYLNKD